ncbi:MAG: hypothetical protein IKC11_05715 [Clostridia bacterium]|nr:hypothetical protein [Clostridia bacterium]
MEKIKTQLEYFIVETKDNCYVFKSLDSALKKLKSLIALFGVSIIIRRYKQMEVEEFLSNICLEKNIRLEE